eukprot:1969049-Rhodomonas_salina.2
MLRRSEAPYDIPLIVIHGFRHIGTNATTAQVSLLEGMLTSSLCTPMACARRFCKWKGTSQVKMMQTLLETTQYVIERFGGSRAPFPVRMSPAMSRAGP